MTKIVLNSDDTEARCFCDGLRLDDFMKQVDDHLIATVVCFYCAKVWHTQPFKREA